MMLLKFVVRLKFYILFLSQYSNDIIYSSLRYCNSVEATADLGSATGTITPKDCPTGFYCLVNTTSSGDYPCPMGTFNNLTGLQTEVECQNCTSGSYCGSTGMCVEIIAEEKQGYNKCEVEYNRQNVLNI